MKNHTFGELCRLHARLHAKVVDQIKNHVFLCHRVAILKLETVWKKVSPEKKTVKKIIEQTYFTALIGKK